MAGFKTHIAVSSTIGAAYGAAAYVHLNMPWPTCLLSAGLCGISGMLPDVDSDSGVPLRETLAFFAAVTPMLMIDRFQHLGLSHESIVLAGGCIYIIIRFGLGELLRRYTVHRGMWHSIPAAAIAGLAAFIICSCPDMRLRLLKAGAVVLGYLSHLVLDELYAVKWSRGRLRMKRSFGTALKFFGKSSWANVSTYGKLLFLGALAVGDPLLMERFGTRRENVPHVAHDFLDQILGAGDDKSISR